MSVCPYCGSEVEEFDCICGKCGKTIEPQSSNKGTTYNSNSSYNSNSYSGSGNGSYGGTNNTYSNQNSGNGDYTIYPPYNPANDSSAYPPYNRSGVGSNPTVKSKKKTALVIGIGIALVVLVMAIILRPIIWEYKTKEYRHVIQAYTEASLKGNYTACYNYVYPNAGKIISDLVGETQALSIMNGSGWITKSVRNSLLDSYNLDYNNIKMKIEMKSISNLSGSKKKNVIEKAKSQMELGSGKYIKWADYLKEEDIEKAVRVDAKIKLYIGEKKIATHVEKYVLVKIKGENSWKILMYELKE